MMKTKVPVILLLSVLAFISLFPLLLTFTNSFMEEAEVEENYGTLLAPRITGEKEYANLKLIPDMVNIKQYYTVLVKRIQFLFLFWNSVKISVLIVLGQLVVSSLAAYAFAKIHFRWREQLFFVYILVMLMPFQVTLVPNYLVADRLGLIGSHASIILPGIFGTFGVFLLRQFMVYIPDQYMEAARMDGAGHLSIFSGIVLPMSKTGLASLAVLSFIDQWNMVEQPLVFLSDENLQPLSVYLSRVNSGEMGVAFAASALYMVPTLLVFLYAENYLIEGIQMSGLKG